MLKSHVNCLGENLIYCVAQRYGSKVSECIGILDLSNDGNFCSVKSFKKGGAFYIFFQGYQNIRA